MKLVKPGDEDSPQPRKSGNVRQLQMVMAIPEENEAMVSVMVTMGKSGQIYVGHMAGHEDVAHQLCIRGADVLFGRIHRALVDAATTRVQPVRSLADVPLPPAPHERN